MFGPAMGCLRRRFMPRPPHRLQQKSRAWLSRETACKQAARQERHRPTMARSPTLAGICFRSARGAFHEEAPNALVMSRQLLERIKSNVGAPYLTHAGRCPSLRRRHPIRSGSQSVCGGSDPCPALAEFARGWMVISAAGPPAPGREGCRWWVWTNPRDREIRGRRSERVVACALRRVLESCAVIVVRSAAS
ncbi:hypothetical protein ACVIOG_006554 [Rhizobium leguminosarum]